MLVFLSKRTTTPPQRLSAVTAALKYEADAIEEEDDDENANNDRDVRYDRIIFNVQIIDKLPDLTTTNLFRRTLARKAMSIRPFIRLSVRL